MVFLKEILTHTLAHTPVLQRHDLKVKHVKFRRMTSSQIMTLVILESITCQSGHPQHILIMAGQNS